MYLRSYGHDSNGRLRFSPAVAHFIFYASNQASKSSCTSMPPYLFSLMRGGTFFLALPYPTKLYVLEISLALNEQNRWHALMPHNKRQLIFDKVFSPSIFSFLRNISKPPAGFKLKTIRLLAPLAKIFDMGLFAHAQWCTCFTTDKKQNLMIHFMVIRMISISIEQKEMKLKRAKFIVAAMHVDADSYFVNNI